LKFDHCDLFEIYCEASGLIPAPWGVQCFSEYPVRLRRGSLFFLVFGFWIFILVMTTGITRELTFPEPAGLYIHIPFCIRKCPYCNFYSVTDISLQSAFVKALHREMEFVSGSDLYFDTIYIGGGTPSILSAKYIDCIIKQAGQLFHFFTDVEVTVEVNPGTINAADLRDYRTAGVNRLNIGIQSFDDAFLEFFGRIHSGQDAFLTFKKARQQGFDNIGLDLIYGLPQQTPTQWRHDLQRAIALEPEHISCYMLTFETGTPMDRKKRQGLLTPLSEGRICELYDIAVQYLCAHGYEQYEISNFARTDKQRNYRSVHNSKYWSFAPYIGLGPSAHSFIHPLRSWNQQDINSYINTVQQGKPPLAGKERLNKRQQIIEMIYVKLRTVEGIDLNQFERKFGICLTGEFSTLIKRLEKQGKLICTPSRLALTPEGMLHHNSITLMFL